MNNQALKYGLLSGDLAIDSPAATNLILRHFEPDILELLSRSYKIVADQGALLENNINRTPGVRFNPRPARIIQILLTEAECRNPSLINNALLDSANPKLFDLNYLSGLESAYYIKIPHLVAYLLDSLRHLHMNIKEQPEVIQKQLYEIEKFYKLNAFNFWPKLNIFIGAAIERSIQRIGKFARY